MLLIIFNLLFSVYVISATTSSISKHANMIDILAAESKKATKSKLVLCPTFAFNSGCKI